MPGFAEELARRLANVEREVRRLRSGLVRAGTVDAVDSTHGTITVAYLNGLTSAPMPWFQRGSEHRPPKSGEHVLVLDPSLQGTSAIAIVGHPSEARPPAGGGGDAHVLHEDGSHIDRYNAGVRELKVGELVVEADSVKLEADAVDLGNGANDYAALASRVDQYFATLDGLLRAWVPVAMDGGAALKAAFTGAFPVAPTTVAASRVRVV